jgi:hypothetical protein
MRSLTTMMMLSNLLQQHLVLQHVVSFEISTPASWEFEGSRLLPRGRLRCGKTIVHFHNSIEKGSVMTEMTKA